MSDADEIAVRKTLWTRKDATDAKMSESEFETLTADEQDAWILSLMLDLTFDQSMAFICGSASAETKALVRARIAEAFKFGKRKALRELKAALARHGQVQNLQEES